MILMIKDVNAIGLVYAYLHRAGRFMTSSISTSSSVLLPVTLLDTCTHGGFNKEVVLSLYEKGIESYSGSVPM